MEVFANDRQAVAIACGYAPQNLAVSLFSRGGDVMVKKIKGRKVRPSNPW